MDTRCALVGLALVALSGCSGGSTPPSADVPIVPITQSPTQTPSPLPSPTASPLPAVTRSASPAASPTPLPTAAPVETAPPPGAPQCKAAALTLTDADTIVTQQSREQVYVVRTTGPDCGLNGFPQVSFTDSTGKVVAVTYSRGPGPARPLSLSRGTSVSFSVTSPRTGTCVDPARISALLPGTTTALKAATTARICGGQATVSSLRRVSADG